jgi:plastocyanin domain-containing protein
MKRLLQALSLSAMLAIVGCSSDDAADEAGTVENDQMQQTQESVEAAKAHIEDGVQIITVKVEDMGYTPKKIEFKAGMPARIVFDQHGTTSCAWDVKSEGLGIPLTDIPEGKQTAVDFTPGEPGEYAFTCGMGMLHGSVVVEQPQESGDESSL